MISGDSVPEPTSRASVIRASVIPLVPVWRVDRAFDYLVPEELREKVIVGSLVRAPFGNRKVRGIVVEVHDDGGRGDRPLETIASLVVDPPVTPHPLESLFDWVARRYVVARGVAFSRAVPPRVRVTKIVVEPLVGDAAAGDQDLVRSYVGGDRLLASIENKTPGVWSLRSLPGHDRGRLISVLLGAAAKSDGAALLTVPEVKYGSQVLDSVETSWPLLARVDSSQEENDRSRAWLAMAKGHGLGGGGRATALAPAPDLTLIVIDEEHHTSYKEDRSPRYDTRRVAVERARLQKAVCVLVSSTPSLETDLKVRTGEWDQIHPDRSARRAARPIVEVVPPSDRSALTTELHARVRDTLRAGQRVGLLVPSRGYARALWCASCKRSLRCPVCEAGLFYDRPTGGKPNVRCTRCGFGRTAPDVCPTCGASEWRYLGAGSERLAEQIGKAFPRAKVRRVDPDVLAQGHEHAFSDADIYVTTWIGTKPALRPAVGLVGVLNADALIRRPDFRAAESAYQALAEMAEWAGPATQSGRLVVQCSEPTHHAVQAVVRADHDFFVERELELRQDLFYPPFTELIKVTASGPDAAATIERAAATARQHGARALGPVPVRRTREENQVVDQEILIKCRAAMPIAESLRELLAHTAPGMLKVDVDPA